MSIEQAVKENNLELVREILEKDRSIVNAVYKFWSHDINILNRVISKGNIKMVKLLLDYEADIKLKNSYGIDAFFAAVISNRIDIVKLLLEKREYNINEINDDDNTLHTVMYLYKPHDYNEMVKFLLDCGTDVNYQESTFSRHILHTHQCFIDHKLVKIILNRKDCNPNTIDNEGDTPLLHHIRTLSNYTLDSHVKTHRKDIIKSLTQLVSDHRTNLYFKNKENMTYMNYLNILTDKYKNRGQCQEQYEILCKMRKIVVTECTLLILCLKYINCNKQKFKSDELMVLPKDVRKYIVK